MITVVFLVKIAAVKKVFLFIKDKKNKNKKVLNVSSFLQFWKDYILSLCSYFRMLCFASFLLYECNLFFLIAAAMPLRSSFSLYSLFLDLISFIMTWEESIVLQYGNIADLFLNIYVPYMQLP